MNETLRGPRPGELSITLSINSRQVDKSRAYATSRAPHLTCDNPIFADSPDRPGRSFKVVARVRIPLGCQPVLYPIQWTTSYDNVAWGWLECRSSNSLGVR
jgi:hypothetical protein